MAKQIKSAAAFKAEVMALIDAGKFDEADQLIEDNAVALPEPMRNQPFQSPMVYKGFDPKKAAEPEGQIAVGFLTGLSRASRNGRYDRMVRRDPDRLRVLEEGDSWHQYPALLTDLIDHSKRRFAIHSLSAPGDTLEEMVLHGEYVTAIKDHSPDVFMISGGGNDLLGQGRFIHLLKPHFDGASAADLINAPVLNASLQLLKNRYSIMIARALAAKSNLQIILHGYDYVIPRKGGRWLGDPLAERDIPLDKGLQIVRLILSQFDAALAALAQDNKENVRYLNLRERAGDILDDWHDEIHPKSNGFARCAEPILKALSDLEDDLLRLRGHSDKAEVAFVPKFRSHESQRGAFYEPSASFRNVAKAIIPNRGSVSIPQLDRPQPHSPAEVERAQRDFERLLQTSATTPEDPERIAARLDYTHNTDNLNYEAIIQNNDMDEFYFLELGHRVGQSVARIFVRGVHGGKGSGFLIGKGLLITNNHVIPNREAARVALATFDHGLKPDNTPLPGVHFQLSDDIFLTSPELDYTILSVTEKSTTEQPLDQFGMLELLPRSGKALKNEHVCIIQHPDGDYKKVTVRGSNVVGRSGNHLYYLADTLPGSSGSPVFNTEWQVAALHHMAIPSNDPAQGYVANRGVRISSILEDIASRRGDPDSDANRVDSLLQSSRSGLVLPMPPTPKVVAPAVVAEPKTHDETGWNEELDQQGELARAPIPESTRPKLPHTAASWPANPRNAPDTWHLPVEFADASFELGPELLRKIAETNSFQLRTGPEGNVIFALRGCRIADGTDMAENRKSIAMTTAVIDHEVPRCVIGVWHASTNRISAFAGSTVPRRTEMKRYYDNVNFNIGSTLANMLPTGCYDYCVGTHHSRRNGAITFVLRQGHGPEPDKRSTVTTLRTSNDLVYGTKDVWDKCRPADNIHPGFISGSFSSQGCLTIPGRQSGHGASHTTGTGAWSHFRRRAGFDGKNRGALFSVLLVTGHEAAAFAHAADEKAISQLACLRHGSVGAPVEEMQRIIGVPDDGDFGPNTKLKLAQLQISKLSFATGTWSTEMNNVMR